MEATRDEVIEDPGRSDEIKDNEASEQDEEEQDKKYLYVDPIGSQFTVQIKIGDDDDHRLNVSQDLLLENSNYFQEFYSTRNTQAEEDLTDFDPDVVILFITCLGDKHIADLEEKEFSIGHIEKIHFRELHKLSMVLQVEWMVIQCEEWLSSRIKEMEKVKTLDEFEGLMVIEEIHRFEADKKYLLDECLYITRRFQKELLLQKLAQEMSLHDNREFLKAILKDCQRYHQNELKYLLEAGNHDVQLFSEIIVQNLEDSEYFNKNIRFLLDNLHQKLSTCSNTEQLAQPSATPSTETDIEIERRTVIWDHNRYCEIRDKHLPKCLDDVGKIVTEEECVDNMQWVLELVFYLYRRNITLSDTGKFIQDLTETSIKPVHSDLIMDFISRTNNTHYKDLLNTIKDSDILCVDEGMKVLNYFKTGDRTLFYKYSNDSCKLDDNYKCGLIVKWTMVTGRRVWYLSTDKDEYEEEKLHNEVDADNIMWCRSKLYLTLPRTITTDTQSSATTSAGTTTKMERNTVIWDDNKYCEIRDKHLPNCLDDVVKIVQEEECVDNMVWVLSLVDYLNSKNITLSDIDKFIQDLTKTSIKPVHSDVIMNYIISRMSNTDYKGLLDKIMDNDTLCVDEGVKVLDYFKRTGHYTNLQWDLTVGYTRYYKYSDSSCTLQGTCGVIVKMRKVTGRWVWYLSTDKHEYVEEGLHLHDEIDADNMVWYGKLYLTIPTITSVDVSNNEAQSTTMVTSVDVGSQTHLW